MSGSRRPRLVGGEKPFRWSVNGTQTELDAVNAVAGSRGVSLNRYVMDAVHNQMRADMQGAGGQFLDPAVVAMLVSAEEALVSALQAIQIAKAAAANRTEVVPQTADSGGHCLDGGSVSLAA